MQDEKWEALKEELNRKFKVEDSHLEDLIVETADGPIKQGKVEVLIFPTPLGKIKLTRESKPVVLDKKVFYSHQQGKSARTEYKFSETEFSHKIKAYKWDPDASVGAGDDNDEWKEIDAGNFGS
ncbi:MAG: hypothetical protein A3B10_01930 [Candidatus Doudnabacteria bacterium RIFCSPLOWO2_01_FULL_44_21]|uniref:Uncharacterized protein n=1 Tax=Candidatus Doudnabacteria bacterium RIFCSPLOWO2_01_FULL_44_21 TaxID=1817841 RepID=A0A1F5Q2M1_9BACT|nr:MAG: hypothetical protein A3B95_01820 [Candidatus Doudnabacteria bacterium RIFCSPHIGHO2_02_FULL_43_13b]OGE96423.1 MAG: hypothetical protein A3B10_01930 [Candidatus Doudnabacteria bacterium RIFCSPLOWO2_01_FULL_44_21]